MNCKKLWLVVEQTVIAIGTQKLRKVVKMDHTYTNGCFEKLHYQITFWAIPCLMTLVLISACFVCLRNKANGHRRYQSDDEATLIELQVPILL